MIKLPCVSIAGKSYIVDERLGELRSVNDPTDTESIELWYYWCGKVTFR